MIIGSGFHNYTDDGDEYISVSLDKAITALYPNLSKVKISLRPIPQDKRVENGPGWSVNMYEPKPKE